MRTLSPPIRPWLLVGLLFAACASVAVVPALAPAAPRISVTPLGATADGDSLRYQLAWSPVDDGRGPPDGYAVSVIDSLGRGVVAEYTASETSTIVTVPAPAWGGSARYTARVYAVRRGLRSPSPASVTWPVTRTDVAPPAPEGLRSTPLAPPDGGGDAGAIDVHLVGTADPGDCRPLVASTLTGLEGDTARFVRVLPGHAAEDVHVYCVATRLAVSLDGWVSGTPELAPEHFGPGAPLPVTPAIQAQGAAHRGA